MLKIAPSILSADFAKLGSEIEDIRNAGADYVHFDVMDGLFVPNITVGIPVLNSLSKATDMFMDVHLMIDRPVRYVEQFCSAGADLLCFHVESDSTENIKKAVCRTKELGRKAGIALKPATPAEAVMPFINSVDLILVMTVEPGFGGQSFMYDQADKVSAVRRLIDQHNPGCELEVDGGINSDTAAYVKKAGADVLVAGSAVFKAPDRAAAVRALREA